MKPIITALLMLMAPLAGAQNVVSMDRLFTTPSERAQLDAQRSQAPASALSAPAAASALGGVGAGTAAPGATGNGTAAPCAPGAAPGCPAAGETSTAGGTIGSIGTGPGGVGSPEQGTQEAPGLRLDGVIRRSNGPAALIVNGEVQPAPPGAVTRGAVTLQDDGRSIVLKPGQRFDPATGETHEAGR